MTQDTPAALARALYKMLRPMVRLLLRHGVSYRLFSEVARHVYVDVAKEDFQITGRKTSYSRVALLTGINRKDIAKLQERPHPLQSPSGAQRNPVARLIDAWVGDVRFQDAAGRPKSLPLEGEGLGFATLVAESCTDLPTRAVLDELVRLGAVELVPDGVRLIAPGYVPHADVQEQLRITSTAVADLLGTLDYNLSGTDPGVRLQRTVSYDNIPIELLERIRRRSRSESEALLLQINEWLGECDRDQNPQLIGSGRARAGIGIYYFESQSDEGPAAGGAAEVTDENQK